jgi:2-desacetyl-2-hydroxyethyl bacteriochlorophyllide A dehydrogenase
LTRQSLYFEEPFRVNLPQESLSPPGPGQVMVETLVSGISPGTELLIYRGQAPTHLQADTTIASLAGSLDFPLKYGYATVGRVRELGKGVDESWLHRQVFAFNPHESHFNADPAALLPLPEGISPEEAVFLPNVETALTLLLDGHPLVGEQVAVLGQGIVGLLLTALLARLPLASLVTMDMFPQRRLVSETVGAQASLDPSDPEARAKALELLQGDRPYRGADLTYEVSGNPAALNQAMALTGYHGRVVIGSWYGNKQAPLALGGDFHRSRMSLISSQVSTIAPELRGRWDKPRLLQLAWQMLAKIKPTRFITHRFPFEKASQAYELLDQRPEEAIQVMLMY